MLHTFLGSSRQFYPLTETASISLECWGNRDILAVFLCVTYSGLVVVEGEGPYCQYSCHFLYNFKVVVDILQINLL